MNIEHQELKQRALEIFEQSGTALSKEEKKNVLVAHFGLNDPLNIGLQLVLVVNTEMYNVKEIAMLPRQTCPEHHHPPLGAAYPGKLDTFRCLWGKVYLYVEGEQTKTPGAKIPEKYKDYFTVMHEIELEPGDHYTVEPNTLHWFQAGDEGAVLSEISSASLDETDIFTDPNIQGVPH